MVTTDGSGDVAFDTTLAGVVTTEGHVVSATATVDLGDGQFGNTSEFAANVTVTHPPADHDDPCSAASIPVNQSCSFQIFSNVDASDSGIPLTQCDGYAGGDIWLKIVVPPAGNVLLQIKSDSIPGIPDTLDMLDQPGLAVYRGTCAAPIYDTCWIDPGIEPPYMDPQILLTGYNPGDTLYLRVWEHSNDDPGKFGICARIHEVKVFNISGSGSYCSGGNGLSVHMDSSEVGVDYQLLKNGIEEGSPLAGTGTALSWPENTEGVYEITATSTISGLSQRMNGRAVVIEDPLPVVTFGYGYDRMITVDSGKVAGLDELVNFPMLVSIPGDPDLRTTDFGGHVQNPNGYDIVFTDENYHPIPFERINYNPEIGAFSAWVNVPSMYFDADTRIHMLYGNPDISADHSSRETWPSAYIQVMHLDGDFTDASFTGNYGLNDGTIDTVGKLGAGRHFDGTDDKIIVYDDPSLDGTNDAATLSLWINFANAADGDHQFVMSTENRFTGAGYEWASQGSGNHFFYPNGIDGNNYNLGPNPFTDSVWHYLAVTLDYSTLEVEIYVDGVPMGFTTENVPALWTGLADLDNWLWGGNPARSSRYFLGSMDEIRVQTSARSGDWLMTEYNNQNDPSGFYSVSPEASYDPSIEVCLDTPPFAINQPKPAGGSFSGPGVSDGTFYPALSGAGDHIIYYQYTDGKGCTSSASKIQRVMGSPVPVITGDNYLCPEASAVTYSTPEATGHSYFWEISGDGASITGGQGTNEITVDWGAASGTVKVRETIDSTGCDSTTAEFVVTIWDVTDPVITCPGDTTEYLDEQCVFTIPDYTSMDLADSNCGTDPVILQDPAAGTKISGAGTIQEIIITAQFMGGHESVCTFNVLLQDTILPGVLSMRDTTITVGAGITETYVTMPLPDFSDNCRLQSVINDFNGGSDASGNYPLGTTTIAYTVTDMSDNSRMFYQQVVVQSENGPGGELIIPEGFSPNEDGLNDRFEILGLEQYPNNELRVFNVHGNEVYRMAGYDNSWDGTSASNLNKGGRLPTGTYYYALYLGVENAVIKGFVYLRRE
jgi:gliding motility-associated-like protein